MMSLESMNIDEVIAYKMVRGGSSVDAGIFYCPYIPGMSQEELDEVTAKIEAGRLTQEMQAFQRKVMVSLRLAPMLNWKRWA